MMPRPANLFCVAALLAAASGCSWTHRPMRISGAAAPAPPTPQSPVTVDRSFANLLTLQYGLPGRAAAPAGITWQTDITDDAGQPCPVRVTSWGKGAQGYWTSVSFAVSPEARQVTAHLTLSLDNVDYPLHAVLNRIDASRWRVDYGIVRQ